MFVFYLWLPILWYLLYLFVGYNKPVECTLLLSCSVWGSSVTRLSVKINSLKSWFRVSFNSVCKSYKIFLSDILCIIMHKCSFKRFENLYTCVWGVKWALFSMNTVTSDWVRVHVLCCDTCMSVIVGPGGHASAGWFRAKEKSTIELSGGTLVWIKVQF